MDVRLLLQNGGVTFLRLYMDGYYIHVYDDRITNTVPESAIHEHPFCFESVVLQGSLSHTLYEAIPMATGKYLKVNYEDLGQSRLGKIYRINDYRYRLQALKDQTFRVGDIFGMTYDEIHSVTNFESVTITNMKILEQRPGHSYIYMTQEQMDAVNKRHADQIALNVEAGKKAMEQASVKDFHSMSMQASDV